MQKRHSCPEFPNETILKSHSEDENIEKPQVIALIASAAKREVAELRLEESELCARKKTKEND